jgi:hypothetical protein
MIAANRLPSRAPAVRGIKFNLINAPAIGAAVRPALLIDRHPDALVESVRAFLKALDPTSILVGKFGRLSSQKAPEQDADALSGGVLRAFVDLLIRESAERVSDHDRGEIVHAERIALHLCLM